MTAKLLRLPELSDTLKIMVFLDQSAMILFALHRLRMNRITLCGIHDGDECYQDSFFCGDTHI